MSGIFGVYSNSNGEVSEELLMGTVALQHRGEEGCGISIPKKDGFYSPKDRQLAYYFFRDRTKGLEGLRLREPLAAIGHTLYEDTGGLQPVETWGENHLLSLAMDGILLGEGGKNDSVMRTLFSRALDKQEMLDIGRIYSAVEDVMTRLDGRGSYCVASLVLNKLNKEVSLVAFRDPRGIKPYCLGKKNKKYIVASESKALDAVESDLIRDIAPGEAVILSRQGINSKRLKQEQSAHCFFEWVYFADPTSVIEGKNVYEVRKELGRILARRYIERVKDLDFVMASPDSGRGVAIGFQQELSKLTNRFIPYEEGFVKNSGAKRTFQVENPDERKLAARVKFFINKQLVHGKKIAVGDDSIVRGTVFKDGMIYKLRKAGALEIIPVISCPALLHACIKDPRGKEFVAYGLDGNLESLGKQVAKKINADFVCYPSTGDMVQAVGLEEICKACIDGEFPVNQEFWR